MFYFNSKPVRSIIGVGALFTAFSAHAASITPLDFRPELISGDGSVVVGSSFFESQGDVGSQLLLFNNGQTSAIANPANASFIDPIGVSTDGTVLVSAGAEHFLYSNGAYIPFTNVSGAENFIPSGISPDGNTFLGFSLSDNLATAQSAILRNGVTESIGSNRSSLHDISSNGVIVGQRGEDAFVIQANQEIVIGDAEEFFPINAHTISNDGSTVLGDFTSSPFGFERGRPFVYREGVATPLVFPDPVYELAEGSDTDFDAVALSADGKTIVGNMAYRTDEDIQSGLPFFPPGISIEGIIWELDEEGNYIPMSLMDKLLRLGLDISAEGWLTLLAKDISEDGRYIIGEGAKTGSPDVRGFLIDLRPVPLPAAFWLFASAFIGLVGFKKAKQRSTTHI